MIDTPLLPRAYPPGRLPAVAVNLFNTPCRRCNGPTEPVRTRLGNCSVEGPARVCLHCGRVQSPGG